VRSPAGRPGWASARARDAVASRVSEGTRSPRATPYRSAAARAWAQENRVDGLFRSAISTTSPSDSTPMLAGVSPLFVAAKRGSGGTTPGGAFHMTLGDGGAPGPPPILGGPL